MLTSSQENMYLMPTADTTTAAALFPHTEKHTYNDERQAEPAGEAKQIPIHDSARDFLFFC
jgi:hypothetical protein